MTSTTFYALRHIATGHFMPTLRGRGYSMWSPTAANPKFGIEDAHDVPRLFATAKGADNARVLWAQGERQREWVGEGPEGHDAVKIKDMGRKKDDLVVVPMLLTPSERCVVHIKLSVAEQGKVMREAFERTLAEYKDKLAQADLLQTLGDIVQTYKRAVTLRFDSTTRTWQLTAEPGTTWASPEFEKVIENASRDLDAMHKP